MRLFDALRKGTRNVASAKPEQGRHATFAAQHPQLVRRITFC